MAQNYYWSPSKVSFYPVSMASAYKSAGTLPADIQLVDDSVFQQFGASPAPPGQTRGKDASNLPGWVDAPALAAG
ncbi:hypothetical protein AA0488_0700 [Kozakia baliensis NRIC 0488]|uniref:Uncharacterized protein n=1 Tax=Kozakia baliensis TaxID=153496 RepID=A0A1D8UTE2_9PROT|nr:hypothetical protein A0U89_06925 [Kozakia baliensis]GBR25630.1 hypothetical protein AA0488_0700 [Kozakia baliensis NRIC 0488]GEL64043.1 hypothetical protein KBA01_13290 [Kozakia baliensis]